MAAVVVAACCLGVLLLAAWLNPNPQGHGTHTQLGMPACGWAAAFNHPCPTCGMTTSFAYAAHLRFWESFKTQPFAFLLAVGTAAGFWVALHVAITGSQLGRTCARMVTPRSLWVLTGLAFAAWAYKWVTWVG
jgi:hypothetical protein